MITIPDSDLVASPRLLWFLPGLNSGDHDSSENMHDSSGRRRPATVADANLISSLCEDGQHRPALDIDWDREHVTAEEVAEAVAAVFECEPIQVLVTPSARNWHAYIPTVVYPTWDAYLERLEAAVDRDLLEPGYVAASHDRAQTFLRPAEHAKPSPPAPVELPDDQIEQQPQEAF